MTETIAFPEPLDLGALSEQECLAFYGALFALAAADDRIDEVESELILSSLDLNGMSEAARERALALSISPPSLQTCLDLLEGVGEDIRFGLMLNLVDVALADDDIQPGEPMTLEQARIALGLTSEQIASMHEYAYRVRRQALAQNVAIRRPMSCPLSIR